MLTRPARPSADEPAARSTTALHLSKLATTGPKPAPITPPKPEEIDAAIHRGIKFLLADQRPDGSWGSPENTKGLNIYAPPPGAHDAFRTGVTSLAIMALIEAEPQARRRAAADGHRRPSTAAKRGSIERLPRLRRATPDALYNVWGHAYAIQALVAAARPRRRRRRPPGPAQETRRRPGRHARPLQLRRRRLGLLRHARRHANPRRRVDQLLPPPPCLIALHEAKSIGVEFPERLTKKAIASIHRQQKPDFSYAYGEYLRTDADASRSTAPAAASAARRSAISRCGSTATSASPTTCSKPGSTG